MENCAGALPDSTNRTDSISRFFWWQKNHFLILLYVYAISSFSSIVLTISLTDTDCRIVCDIAFTVILITSSINVSAEYIKYNLDSSDKCGAWSYDFSRPK